MLAVAALPLVPFPARASGESSTASVVRDTAGRQRVLIIDTPDTEADLFRIQAAALVSAWAGLIERDMRVVTRVGAPAFRVRLIGKDGGEKLDTVAPVSAADLVALIDAMPMRRAEAAARRDR